MYSLLTEFQSDIKEGVVCYGVRAIIEFSIYDKEGKKKKNRVIAPSSNINVN